MCRSVSHGGRRCPHADDSNARALRRANARLKSGYAEGVVAASKTLANSSDAGAIEEVSASVSISESIAAVDKTKKALNSMMSQGFSWDGTVDGEKFHNYDAAYVGLQLRLEQQIRGVGAAIAFEVESRSDVKYADIAKYSVDRKVELQAQMDELIELEKALKKEAVEVFGVSEFLALDNARMKFHNNPEDVELGEFISRVEKFDKDGEKARKEYYAFIANNDEQLIQMWNTNRDLLKQVMGEHRDFGGELKVDDSSDKRKAAILSEAVGVYPSDWIEASNKNDASLKVKKTVGRAHYNRSAAQVKVLPMFQTAVKPEGWEPDGTRNQSGWTKLEADENGIVTYKDEDNHVDVSYYVSPGESLWLKPVWEYANRLGYSSSFEKPRGRGWEQAQIVDSVKNFETGEYSMKEVTVWRRQAKQKQHVGELKAELLIDGSKGRLVDTEGYDSAVHEFAHRVEDSNVPFLKEMQDTFYRRRTEVDGVPMAKVRLYRGKNEFAIPDDFTSDYMGKRYTQDKHFELLSTGMEAVFGNGYGGLVGVGGKKADLELRDFILGAIATL